MTNGDGRGFSLRREGRQVSNQRGEFTERVCPKGAIESQLEVGEAETAFCDAALKQVGHVLAFGIGSEQLRCGRVEQERWGSGPRADRRELGPHGDKVDAGGDDPADIEENRQQNQEKNPPGLVAADLVERRRGPPGSINDRPERNAEGNENTDSDEKETLHLTCLRKRQCALYVRHAHDERRDRTDFWRAVVPAGRAALSDDPRDPVVPGPLAYQLAVSYQLAAEPEAVPLSCAVQPCFDSPG